MYDHRIVYDVYHIAEFTIIIAIIIIIIIIILHVSFYFLLGFISYLFIIILVLWMDRSHGGQFEWLPGDRTYSTGERC